MLIKTRIIMKRMQTVIHVNSMTQQQEQQQQEQQQQEQQQQ